MYAEYTGLQVLDLGCGSGRDCYVASALVGESGSVTGLDMTDEQLEVTFHGLHSFFRHLDIICITYWGQRVNMSRFCFFVGGHRSCRRVLNDAGLQNIQHAVPEWSYRVP